VPGQAQPQAAAAADEAPGDGEDLTAGEVCWRMSSRWREENYFRYARARFALDALDSYAAAPDDPDRMMSKPGQEDRGRPHPGRRAGHHRRRDGPGRRAAPAAQPPARPPTYSQVINVLAAPVEAARRDLDGHYARRRRGTRADPRGPHHLRRHLSW
jgi:hypothetical protein